MKILTICQEIKEGGFYDRYLSLIEAMLEQGWEVHYLSAAEFPIKHPNLRFHKTSPIRGINAPLFARFMPSAVLRGMYLARKQAFDRIVVFGSAYGFIGWALKKTFGIPLVTFLRADLLENLRIQGRQKLVKPTSVMQKFAFGASDKIIVNISAVGDKVRSRYNIPEKKVSLIHNDIPPEFRKPAKVRRGRDIGFVGVLEKRKGIDTLLKAYQKVHGELGRRLVIVGSGPMRKDIEEFVKSHGLSGKVVLAGWKPRTEIKRLMSSFSLLVAPSLSEGCPNTVLEALGCGTPCIGSDIPEIREILGHDELLFAPGNSYDTGKRILEAFRKYDTVKSVCLERKERFVFDWKQACIEAIENIRAR